MEIMRKYWVLFVVISICALHACILWLMGQPLISKSGTVSLWNGFVQSSENSQHISDWYTFSHLIHGFIFFWLLYPLRNRLTLSTRLFLAMGIEIGWEVLENTDFIINRYREATIALDYYGDSVLNSVCDVIAATLGFLAAARMRWFVTLGLLIVMELVVGYMIRDNLALNVLMLTYPLESVKMWQGGF